ncbi:MAG: hypothetical protein CM1200mP26_06350 [Acidimicrobiales bacterium]|nr:MAG: hypothetical protein CM1200mP26_06350 [Acidimicrobiales bacterium]
MVGAARPPRCTGRDRPIAAGLYPGSRRISGHRHLPDHYLRGDEFDRGDTAQGVTLWAPVRLGIIVALAVVALADGGDGVDS